MGPCDVKVCRICFAMDCELHLLHKNMELYKGYEAVTGLMLGDEEDLPRYLCISCADQLMNCAHFRHRSLQAHLMLLDILKTHDHISVESIQAVIKTSHCDSEMEVEKLTLFENVKIEVKLQDIPTETAELVDEIKTECMHDVGADDMVDDEADKEDMVEESGHADVNVSKVKGGDDGTLDDDLPSEQDGKVNIIGARRRTEVSEYINKREVNQRQVADLIKTVKLPHGLSGHKPKPHYCILCKKSFSYMSNLERHLQKHSDYKPFSCDVCQMSFRSKNIIQKHMSIHSGSNSCDVCNKSYRRKFSLKTHMLTHSNKKPFKCNVCGKSFHRKSYLSIHMVTHSDEKPFKCNVCGKSFNRKSNLTSHKLTHSDEKPFECKVCGKSFNRKGNLKSHMLTHFDDKPHS